MHLCKELLQLALECLVFAALVKLADEVSAGASARSGAGGWVSIGRPCASNFSALTGSAEPDKSRDVKFVIRKHVRSGAGGQTVKEDRSSCASCSVYGESAGASRLNSSTVLLRENKTRASATR